MQRPVRMVLANARDNCHEIVITVALVSGSFFGGLRTLEFKPVRLLQRFIIDFGPAMFEPLKYPLMRDCNGILHEYLEGLGTPFFQADN